jgi:hypothetical protein
VIDTVGNILKEKENWKRKEMQLYMYITSEYARSYPIVPRRKRQPTAGPITIAMRLLHEHNDNTEASSKRV